MKIEKYKSGYTKRDVTISYYRKRQAKYSFLTVVLDRLRGG